ncbi:MAG: precorrin-6A/cobalt-precorrin-6A reductase, partial [Rhodospirillales bacterium]|nr:precorrin-6A/cobalt-precorrin-6A reductase [Rhodospirillales bacterium]
LDAYAVITGRPPFSETAEATLLREYRIDTLVSKHSGGSLPAKITAAVVQDIPLVLIRQPSAPFGAHVETIDDAVAWIQDRL